MRPSAVPVRTSLCSLLQSVYGAASVLRAQFDLKRSCSSPATTIGSGQRNFALVRAFVSGAQQATSKPPGLAPLGVLSSKERSGGVFHLSSSGPLVDSEKTANRARSRSLDSRREPPNSPQS